MQSLRSSTRRATEPTRDSRYRPPSGQRGFDHSPPDMVSTTQHEQIHITSMASSADDESTGKRYQPANRRFVAVDPQDFGIRQPAVMELASPPARAGAMGRGRAVSLQPWRCDRTSSTNTPCQ